MTEAPYEMDADLPGATLIRLSDKGFNLVEH